MNRIYGSHVYLLSMIREFLLLVLKCVSIYHMTHSITIFCLRWFDLFKITNYFFIYLINVLIKVELVKWIDKIGILKAVTNVHEDDVDDYV